MHLAKLIAPVSLGAALILSANGPAFAGACNVGPRNTPLIAGDLVKITCRKNSLPVTVGKVGSLGQRFMSAELIVQAGPGSEALVTGIGSDGRVIAGCSFADSATDGIIEGGRCSPAPPRWIGQVFHPEG
jgi:hypothetical protein